MIRKERFLWKYYKFLNNWQNRGDNFVLIWNSGLITNYSKVRTTPYFNKNSNLHHFIMPPTKSPKCREPNRTPVATIPHPLIGGGNTYSHEFHHFAQALNLLGGNVDVGLREEIEDAQNQRLSMSNRKLYRRRKRATRIFFVVS